MPDCGAGAAAADRFRDVERAAAGGRSFACLAPTHCDEESAEKAAKEWTECGAEPSAAATGLVSAALGAGWVGKAEAETVGDAAAGWSGAAALPPSCAV